MDKPQDAEFGSDANAAECACDAGHEVAEYLRGAREELIDAIIEDYDARYTQALQR